MHALRRPDLQREPTRRRPGAILRTDLSGRGTAFGDLGDEDSEVSQLVAERGGMDLMPELGTKPVNKYLPPRPKDTLDEIDILAPLLAPVAEDPKGFMGWLDKTLEKL